MIYRHYKNGKRYLMVSQGVMIQENDVWVPAILYQALDEPHPSLFVRSKEEFMQKFTEVHYD